MAKKAKKESAVGLIVLPEWASFRVDDKGEALRNVSALKVDVNAPEMYETLFAELRACYASGHADFNDAEGNLTPEWKDALADLGSDAPSAYWCEVAYQMGKVDLQVACSKRADNVSAFALNIFMRDPTKAHAQNNRPQKRDSALAAGGGMGGGREARAHYKRLRGFFPG